MGKTSAVPDLRQHIRFAQCGEEANPWRESLEQRLRERMQELIEPAAAGWRKKSRRRWERPAPDARSAARAALWSSFPDNLSKPRRDA